jgi:hypothetical protein
MPRRRTVAPDLLGEVDGEARKRLDGHRGGLRLGLHQFVHERPGELDALFQGEEGVFPRVAPTATTSRSKRCRPRRITSRWP